MIYKKYEQFTLNASRIWGKFGIKYCLSVALPISKISNEFRINFYIFVSLQQQKKIFVK